jgi:site-specific DNA-methyltransferase (adenine-specific)
MMFRKKIQKVILGDCLEVMKDIPDKSIDMVLCDLPYQITKCEWDIIVPFEPLWEQYKRVTKDGAAIVLTASQPFTSMLVMSNLKMFKYSWVWKKNKPTGHLNAKRMPMKNYEDIVIFSNGCNKYFPQGCLPYNKTVRRGHNGKNYSTSGKENFQEATNYPRLIIDFILCEAGGLHPTQKPVALFEYLIKTYTNEGDVVLDNAAGSGTTGVACKNLNRQFILIEKEQKYYDIILKRLADVGK